MQNNKQKTFLIINLSYFGDVLLTNSLCQNIKKNYPDSKVVFCVNKNFYEAAKNQVCVDDVICMDKCGEHKGFLGLIKFILNCPYRNKIDVAFITYSNDRGILISYLLGSKRRITATLNYTRCLLTDVYLEVNHFKSTQDINGSFIEALTGRPAEIVPIKYNPDLSPDTFIDKLAQLYQNREIVALCTTSKNKEKDMPVKTAVEIVEKLTKLDKTVFYLGAGAEARKFADDMKKSGCVNFVDLTNVTSINQLARILKMCKGLISVDTGTMHLACALGVPVEVIFYKTDMIEKWAPRDFLYKSIVIDKDYSSEYILQKFELLLNE